MAVSPAAYADTLIRAVDTQDGQSLAHLFQLGSFSGQRQPLPTYSDAVAATLHGQRPQRIQSALLRCGGFLAAPWTEIATSQLVVSQRLAFLPAAGANTAFRTRAPRGFGYDSVVDDGSGSTTRDCVLEAWEAINALVTALLRWFASLQSGRWAIAPLILALSNHRRLSVLADNAVQTQQQPSSSRAQNHLEECARQLNKAFSACVADRTAEEDASRKWGTYEVVGLVFRGYFKLKTLGLCRNILRAIAAADLPPLESFPLAQQVTFKYYTGVLAFLGEDYSKAEADLAFAFSKCHWQAKHNQEMILQFLIPCRLLRGTLPSKRLLSRFPRLTALFSPFVTAIRKGDVQSYDATLGAPAIERALVQNGIYLAVERAREICLRGLLKRVYRCKDKSSRIAIEDFHTALRFVGVQIELLETEWLVATQIAKGYLRGYISHGHMMTVLSAHNPFPQLQSVPIT